MTNTIILPSIHEDRMQFTDSINNYRKPIKAVVTGYQIRDNEEPKHIITKNNMIVYRARANAIARMFGTDPSTDVDASGIKDQYVKWFAIGSGGSDALTNRIPNVVDPVEYQLSSHMDIRGGVDPTKYYVKNNSNITYKKFDDTYPKFYSDQDVSPLIQQSGLSDKDSQFNDHYRDSILVAELHLTIDRDEANALVGDNYISELGLFFSDRLNPTATSGNNYLDMFSKFTMPSFPKNNTIRYEFSWFIYF